MVVLPESIALTECVSNNEVIARIVPLFRRKAVDQINGLWWSELNRLSGTRETIEPDEHWDWGAIADQSALRAHSWCVAAETPDGHLQGAIAYQAGTASRFEPGKNTVAVAFIATAPWNRGWLVRESRYGGAGTGLLLRAVVHSYLLGLEGRTSLSAFPTERVTSFYRQKGFNQLERNDDGTIEFELPAEIAVEWLREEGVLG